MSTTTEIMKPLLHAGEGDEWGGAIQVDVYSRYDMHIKGISLRQMLSQNYGLYPHTNGKLKCNEDERKYRDSGLWYQSKGKHGEVEFNVTVGCSHEHDCCGCMCGLGITLQKTESHFTVIKKMSFNY